MVKSNLFVIVIFILISGVILFQSCHKNLPAGVVAQVDVKANKGATITTTDGKVTLEIPPNAISNNTTVTISTVQNPPAYPNFDFITSNGNCYNIDIGNATIVDSLSLKSVYTVSGNMDESSISLAYYDTTYKGWVFAGGIIDTNNNYISIKTMHLSDWLTFYIVPPTITNKKLIVPYYSQGDAQWCVPTSMAMEMKHFGYDYEYYEVAAKFGFSPEQGLEQFDNIVGLAGNVYSSLIGIAPYRFYFSGLGDWIRLRNVIGNLIQIDKPSVLNSLQARHAVVVIGWSQDYVYFNDPSGYYNYPNNPNRIRVEMTWANFFQHIGFIFHTLDALTINQIPENKRKGTIELNKFGFNHYRCELAIDGRYPCGYHYTDPNNLFPDDPSGDGYFLGNMPRTSDSLALLCYLFNVTTSSQSYQVIAKVFNRRTNTFISTIKEKTVSVSSTSIDGTPVLLFSPDPPDCYLLNNLTPNDRYTIRVYLYNSGILQDSFGIHFNLAPGVNNLPNDPQTPTGPTSGYTNVSYSFTTSTTDPDNDQISYQFYWGDGNSSSWSSFVPSGTSVTMQKSWTSAGIYQVRARAKDEHGLISNYSNPLTITISTPNNPPNTPSTPSGPSSGNINISYSFSTSTTDPENDNISYQFDWGNGIQSSWSNYVSSGTSVTMSYTWSTAGTYYVKARAKDINGNISGWSTNHQITITLAPNNPPNIPSTPSGPTSGQIYVAYNFTALTTDPENDNISYQFDWGDGFQSSWSNYVTSGTSITMAYTWSTAGTYQVKARAKDINGNVSGWSGALQITISGGTNNPPNTPVTPSGPSSGNINTTYSFSSSAIDPDGDNVAIRFDWGNGVISDWSSDVPSGQSVTMNYSWSTAGTYNVKAQARDEHGAISDWSSEHQIIISSPGYPNHVVATIPVGSAPRRVVVKPYGDYVYVICNINVSVIRTSDNTVVATIPVGSAPWVNLWAGTVLPNGSYVYVTNYANNTVSVIRTSDNTVVATISVGSEPLGVAVVPSGNYVYVANQYSDNVSVIRTSDNTVVATIPIGDSPRDVISLPNGNYVYVTNYNSNNVSVIRTSDNTVVATITVGINPEEVGVIPNGSYIYVANGRSNTVSVIRTSDNTVVATIPVGNWPIGIGALPNCNYVYVTNHSSDNVSVIRTSDNTVVATIPAGDSPDGVAPLPNGNYMYVANFLSNNVSVIGY